nr:replication protein RepA [Bifidobacterium aerophilum]
MPVDPVTGELILNDRLSTVLDIMDREPSAPEIWFGHSILTSTLFPTVQPDASVPFISKRNGRYEFLLEPGIDSETRQRKFPSGKYPRLLMAWMAKQIRSAGGRKTDIVDPEAHQITIPTFFRLCAELGLPRGGKTVESLREQLRLLLACHISIRRTTGFVGGDIHDTVSLPIVKAVRHVRNRKNADLSGASFILTDEVWERLQTESAPFDVRVTKILLSGKSVMPYDVYIWLTASANRLSRDTFVSWEWLFERFGDGFKDEADFRKKFRQALAKVREVYPALNVTVPSRGKGIILHRSEPSVPPRAVRNLPLPEGKTRARI